MLHYQRDDTRGQHSQTLQPLTNVLSSFIYINLILLDIPNYGMSIWCSLPTSRQKCSLIIVIIHIMFGNNDSGTWSNKKRCWQTEEECCRLLPRKNKSFDIGSWLYSSVEQSHMTWSDWLGCDANHAVWVADTIAIRMTCNFTLLCSVLLVPLTVYLCVCVCSLITATDFICWMNDTALLSELCSFMLCKLANSPRTSFCGSAGPWHDTLQTRQRKHACTLAYTHTQIIDQRR